MLTIIGPKISVSSPPQTSVNVLDPNNAFYQYQKSNFIAFNVIWTARKSNFISKKNHARFCPIIANSSLPNLSILNEKSQGTLE